MRTLRMPWLSRPYADLRASAIDSAGVRMLSRFFMFGPRQHQEACPPGTVRPVLTACSEPVPYDPAITDVDFVRTLRIQRPANPRDTLGHIFHSPTERQAQMALHAEFPARHS